MKKRHFLISAVLALATVGGITLSGCQGKRPEVYPVSYSLWIPEGQIAQTISRAQAGDKDAAFKLSRHYGAERDRPSEFFWLTRAAELDHTVAQYNLGQSYTGVFNPQMKDLEKARFWLQKAASNGDQNAAARLQDLPSLKFH